VEEEENCPVTATARDKEAEEEVLYTWVPPLVSYPCPAGWYCCDICPERRRTDQGKSRIF
jgi:hypothetical protein